MFEYDTEIENDLKKIGKKSGFENLYLYLSNDCDFYCKHCYLGERLIKRESMELKDVRKYLQFWKQMGSKKLCFIGGEPTLYPYLRESVDYAKNLNYEKIIVGSNGSKRAREVLLKFSSSDLSYIQISLDGATETTNDYIRRPGAFREVVETIHELVSACFDIRIIMTVNSYNYREVIKMIELAEELGVSLVKFHIMSEIGNAHKTELHALEPEVWIEVCKGIEKYAREKKHRKCKISYQPAYEYRKNANTYVDEYKGCVGKNLERISVFPDGKCYVCSFLFDYGVYYAKLEENMIKKCKDSEFAFFFQTQCQGCSNKCRFDGCVAEDIVTNRKFCIDNPEIFPVCRLWKKEL